MQPIYDAAHICLFMVRGGKVKDREREAFRPGNKGPFTRYDLRLRFVFAFNGLHRSR